MVATTCGDDLLVAEEPLISRSEVVTIMFLISDIALAARRFVELAGGADGGEEENDEEPDDG